MVQRVCAESAVFFFVLFFFLPKTCSPNCLWEDGKNNSVSNKTLTYALVNIVLNLHFLNLTETKPIKVCITMN